MALECVMRAAISANGDSCASARKSGLWAAMNVSKAKRPSVPGGLRSEPRGPGLSSTRSIASRMRSTQSMLIALRTMTTPSSS